MALQNLSFKSEGKVMKSTPIKVTGDFGLQLSLPTEGCKIKIRQSMDNTDYMSVKEVVAKSKVLSVGVYYVIPNSYIVFEVNVETGVTGKVLLQDVQAQE